MGAARLVRGRSDGFDRGGVRSGAAGSGGFRPAGSGPGRFRSGVLALLLAASGCEEEGGAGGPLGPDPAPGTARIERVEIVSDPAAEGTYLAGEDLVFGVWLTSGEAVEAAGEVFLVFDLGLAREPAALADTEGESLEFRYRIRRGDYDGDGVSVPAGELVLAFGASLRVGGAELDPALPELPPVEGHRVFARFAPGESVVFDETLDRFLAPSLGVSGAVGCTSAEGVREIAEAVLEQNLPGAAALWRQGWLTGRCGTLAPGESAIFLSASVEAYEGDIYDLALAFGPGELVTGPVAANWWTLADFLAPAP